MYPLYVDSNWGGGCSQGCRMPQRSLLAYAGITQARLIPQLEVAANRVVDVGGVYFFR